MGTIGERPEWFEVPLPEPVQEPEPVTVPEPVKEPVGVPA